MEALLEARHAGKIRFIGFTGHKDPLVHLRMLDMARKHNFHFHAVQMPLNVMDAHFRSFGQQVVPRLVEEKIGVLGMKPMADANILKSNTATAVECLHYAMSLPTSTVITGMDSMDRLNQGLNAARTFKPMSKAEMAALLQKTAPAAAEGKFEPFKTTSQCDGTAHNPQGPSRCAPGCLRRRDRTRRESRGGCRCDDARLVLEMDLARTLAERLVALARVLKFPGVGACH